ncbi:MAG: transcriptional regulator PpsR [Steroidobacteraceae bacterium]
MKQSSGVGNWFGGLGREDAARIITAASDVALVVSADGNAVIRDVSIGSQDIPADLAERWVGKPWIETVTAESRSTVEAILKGASGNGVRRWRQVHHPSLRGENVPVLYTAVQLGREGVFVAIGRSMLSFAALQRQLIDAQQSAEREYARVRQIETRLQLMFQVSSEPVIILDANSRKVVEINPAAANLLGGSAQRLMGRVFAAGLDAAGRQELEAVFATVKVTGRGGTASVRLGGDMPCECTASVALFREGNSVYFLVRLAPVELEMARQNAAENASRVFEIVRSSPDGFVVTEVDGHVLFANRAFLDIVQLTTEDQARAESLGRWLGGPGVDFSLLTAQLREHSTLRLFATTLRGEYGVLTDVEICGVAVPDGEAPYFGFTIRDVSKRVKVETRIARDRPRSVEQLTELVGRVPLRELVRESTDMIERLCIEAALELTNDNRASAAEILGLSRQSLYAKLRRYGLGDLEPREGGEVAPDSDRT